MGTGSVDRVIKDDIHKIFQEYGIFGVRSKTLLQENLENALEELIHDVLKAQKEEAMLDNRFLIYMHDGTMRVSHYNCDWEFYDTKTSDGSLVEMNKAAENHLKECKDKNS